MTTVKVLIFKEKINIKEWRYHSQMMLHGLNNLRFDKGTRDYLDVDLTERQILIDILEKTLKAMNDKGL
jgi:hypothetical protein